MAEDGHERPRKFYVAGPEGPAPTEDEALEMGFALFDAINADRAERARDVSGQPPDRGGEARG